MIKAMQGTWKFPKDQMCRKGNFKLENDHGLDLRVYGCAIPNEHCPDAGVGILVVTKELKHHLVGYLIKISHEEFISGAYKNYED